MSKYRRQGVVNLLNPQMPPAITFGTNEPDDDLPLVCQKCGHRVAQYDPAGGAWCDEKFCDQRARIIWQGYRSGYPKLTITGVGINPGQEGWVTFARYAPDHRILAVLQASQPEGRAA